jgi:hypothetical protein
MNTIKLILDQTNWLEVTFIDENDKVIHCESFSGHKEHIALLREKASEFGTELEEYEELIAECESKFVHPSDEEIQAEITANLVQEAKNYLASTDYKMTVDYFATLSEVEQNELILKRAEARDFIRANE